MTGFVTGPSGRRYDLPDHILAKLMAYRRAREVAQNSAAEPRTRALRDNGYVTEGFVKAALVAIQAEDGQTTQEVAKRIGCADATARKALGKLIERGQARREGDPFRYGTRFRYFRT